MKNQRSKFSIPAAVTYLNCAYMSPLLKSVEKIGIQGILKKRNPFSIAAADFFSDTERLRAEYAKLIHAPDPRRIVVIPSVSYGLSTAARNIAVQPGERIVLVAEQFPSNYYPWHRLASDSKADLHVVRPPEGRASRGRIWNERILEAIHGKTRIVAMGNVHWADGTLFDLLRIRKRSREVGAKLIIDGTQSVGALPTDVSVLQPDALICGGYKWLMGPYSLGLAYYGEHFDGGIPIEENWMNRHNSEDFAGLVNYRNEYQPGSLRYEVGEHSNFILVPMMIEALRQINAWGPANIQRYCKAIAEKGIQKLQQRGFWIEEEGFRGHHVFGIRFPEGTPMDEVRERIKKKKIAVSFRGDSLRVSPHLYNSKEDFDALVKALT